ncbi:cGMP-dependent protein kinase [Phytophthora ramorum]|uniref:cGMP-dependent protein kinase n=1 Tax=Phytophthora ramorum TaxID=164328 RepID=UPI0030B76A20|nr:cGMP-dependent protein kinase [Phytophthora ramorum]
MGCMNSVPNQVGQTFDPVIMSDDAVERKMSILLREKRKDAMRRGDIFGESVQFDTPLELKSVAKSAESTGIIRQALLNNFLFYTIGHSDIDSIVDFMAEKTACAGEVVIKEGDTGDFFYIVETGLFSISVHGNVVNTVQRGATFGELALVYNCPRTASVTCSQSGRLWTLDRVTFRRLVARIQSEQIGECKNALRKVSLLHALTETQLSQLAEASQFVKFAKGDRIIKKGERGNVLYIIKSGAVICTDVGDSHRMESVRLTENDYFGERALMTHEPRAANVTAETDVTLIALDRQAFDDQLGSLREVIDHNMSMRVLQSIPMLKVLSPSEKEKLFLALEPVSFADGEYVIKEGDHGTAFYIIKSGSAVVSKSITSDDENGESATEKRQVATLSTGNFFGEMSLLHGEPRQADVIANGNLECLSLDQGKFVELLGPIQEILNREAEERMAALKMQEQRQIKLDDLEVLRTLGAGTFGRVKLVRHKPTGAAYALKVLNKASVVAYKQQRNVVNEKMIMAQCNHPFLLKLFTTYKDATRLYLLIDFVQGGELFTYLHSTPSSPGRLPNDHARFYASHVLMALEYLHDRCIVYRDLKPENLLIDPQGYLKVVDFGFAKVVDDRTYTLCGTTEYLAPELVLGKGHNRGVDYWALGILIYEMVVGHSPFAGSNQVDQMQICRNIVKEKVEFPGWVSSSCRDIILKLLERDLTKRLGLTHGGARTIRSHAWFTKLDWDAMRLKKVNAPYRPKLADPLDASKFEAINDHDEEVPAYKPEGYEWDKDF